MSEGNNQMSINERVNEEVGKLNEEAERAFNEQVKGFVANIIADQKAILAVQERIARSQAALKSLKLVLVDPSTIL